MEKNKKFQEDSYDIVIIGGGASGMMAAVCSGRFFMQKNIPARIAIVEKHARLGRKLLATGNGRCNLSNIHAGDGEMPDHYYSGDPDWFSSVLSRYTPDKTIRFFESIGILCRTKDNGKIYPFCEQAFSVVEALEQELDKLHIKRYTSCEVKQMERISGKKCDRPDKTGECANSEDRMPTAGFLLSCEKTSGMTTEPLVLRASRVIASTGGKASPALSSDGLGYALMSLLGHSCTELSPAIVQLCTPVEFVSPLAGTKWNVAISLMQTGKNPRTGKEDRVILKQETGELLFTKYGISGPPVLQLSGHIPDISAQECYAVIDFLPEFTVREFVEVISERIREFQDMLIRRILVGILPYKIALALSGKIFRSREDLPVSSMTPRDIALLVSQVKNFPLKIEGTTGWKEAQVTSGGIRCSEVDPETMESLLCKGLYLTGELLDVNGDCGGYNLQFAWACGALAGEAAAASVMVPDGNTSTGFVRGKRGENE